LLVGITIDRYNGVNPSALLRLTRVMGLNFVEITKTVFDDLPQVLAALGHTKTGFHLPYYEEKSIDFSNADYQSEIDELISLINQHHQSLHIQYCLSHPPEGDPANVNRERAVTTLLNNLKKIEALVILENVTSISPDQFNDFYRQAQHALGAKLIGQCYDPAHAFIRGDDPVMTLEHSNGEIRCVHLSDCTRTEDKHLPFDLGGELPVDEILMTLKNIKYEGIINLELLPRSFADLEAVVRSYLKVLYQFEKVKFINAKLKLFFILPVLKKKFGN